MRGVYPILEPYESGRLNVGDGHWETCGDQEVKPAVVLDGGPGSGSTLWHRRLFDPAGYRIVLYDQSRKSIACGSTRRVSRLPQ